MITNDEIAEIERLEKLCTPGPWENEDYRAADRPDWRSTGLIWARTKGYYHPGEQVCQVYCDKLSAVSEQGRIDAFEANAAFIAAARQAVPKLIERIRELEREKESWGNEYVAVHMAKERAELAESRVRELEGALEFYADETSWGERYHEKTDNTGWVGDVADVIEPDDIEYRPGDDFAAAGKRARAALKEKGGG